MDGQDSPKYKGVRKRKWGKWVSEIRLPNSRERIWLGSFDSPEKAARAFDAALYCLRGPGAAFNFPENPPVIPGGRSLSPPEIQAVAHRFGNEVALPQQPPTVNYARGEMDSSREDNDDDVDGDGTGGGGGGVTLTRTEVDNVNGVNGNASRTTMDWSFLTTLDTGDVGPAGFGHFHDDVANGFFQPQYYPPLFSFCDDGGNNNCFGDEDFSNHSFPWNF